MYPTFVSALKHHTSKISNFSDVASVDTFGFRGEALSSLCALSELSVTTRHETADQGTKIVYDANGIIVSEIPAARSVGTTVVLSSLFHSLPVRRKEFERNLKREFAKMTHILTAYCVISTGVRYLSCIVCSSLSVGKNDTKQRLIHPQNLLLQSDREAFTLQRCRNEWREICNY